METEAPMRMTVRDNPAKHRFEAVADERGPGAAAAAQPCPLAASSPRQ